MPPSDGMRVNAEEQDRARRFTLSDYTSDEGLASSSHSAYGGARQSHLVDTASASKGKRDLVSGPSRSTSPPASREAQTGVAPPSAALLAHTTRTGTRRQALPGTSPGPLRLHGNRPVPIPIIVPPQATTSAEPANPFPRTPPQVLRKLLSGPSSTGYLDPPLPLSTPTRPSPSFLSARTDSGQTNDSRSVRSLAYSDVSGKHGLVNGDDKIELANLPSSGASGHPSAAHHARPRSTWFDRFFPSSLPCRLLLLTVFLQAIFDLAIEGNILYRFRAEVHSSAPTDIELENKRRLPVYLVIFGLAHLWQITLAIVAIRTKNTIQVFSLTLFNFAFLGYAVIEVWELRKILGQDLEEALQNGTIDSELLSLPLNILTGLVIAVIALSSLCLVALTYFLRKEFGWQRYRFLGADLRIRTLYYRFQIFECVCYFSAFFCAGFGIQFIWLVLQKTDAEYVVTWVMFPLSILLLIMGRFAAKYERRIAMYAFFFGLTCGIAYFVFKLVRIWQQTTTVYSNVSTSLTVFAALSLVSLLGSLIGGFIVSRGFGRGLRDALTALPGTWSGLAGQMRRLASGNEGPDEEEIRREEMAAKRISIG